MKKTLFLLAAGLSLVALTLSSFSRKTGMLPAESGEPTFKSFLKQFPKAALPYTIDQKTLRQRLDNEIARQTDPDYTAASTEKRLDWKYYDFLPELKNTSRFSRMPVFATPVAQFAAGDVTAVLYVSGRGYSRSYGDYSVALFDKSGKHLATNKVAGVYPLEISTATIDADLTATTETWMVVWEKDYVKTDLEENRITGFTRLDGKKIDLRVAPKASDEDSDVMPPEIEEAPAEEEGTSE